MKPALFTFKEVGWHWVWLSELAEIVGWSSEKILETFSDLAKAEYLGGKQWGISDLHWRNARGEGCCDSGSHIKPSDVSIYVPAGFSNDVLQVRHWGVIRLKRLIHGGLEAPKGSLRNFYINPDPADPRKNQMAILGLTSEISDKCLAYAPVGKCYPLLG